MDTNYLFQVTGARGNLGSTAQCRQIEILADQAYRISPAQLAVPSLRQDQFSLVADHKTL
jgi:hypothetical protein